MGRTDDINDARRLAYEENAALERLRRDPNWRPGMNPAWTGPPLIFKREAMAIDSFRPRESFLTYRAQIVPYAQPPAQPHSSLAFQKPCVDRDRLPFGQRIRDLRRALRWTQRDAAEHLGMSVRTVIRHERGQSVRLHCRLLWRLRELELAYAADLAALPTV